MQHKDDSGDEACRQSGQEKPVHIRTIGHRAMASTAVCIASRGKKHHHHHHHFICPIIQQYAHFREYDSRRAGQQGPIRTLTAALKTFNKKQSLGAYSITQIKILKTRKTRQIYLFNAIPKNI